MRKQLITALIGAAFTSASFAITVEEVIQGYIDNTGGVEAWAALQGMKLQGEMQQGNMKFPFTVIQLKDGRQATEFEVQGKKLKQQVYDGNVVWSTNFQTMKAEQASSEDLQNFKNNLNDFPFALFDYKKKGYKVELMGEEKFAGTDTYKVKVQQEPLTIDGKQVDDIVYYYFDKDALVPVGLEGEMKKGPGKGMTMVTQFSDYQEVEGLVIAYTTKMGVKDSPGMVMTFKAVELNPSVSADVFAQPKAE